jgi:hypothetical protein
MYMYMHMLCPTFSCFHNLLLFQSVVVRGAGTVQLHVLYAACVRRQAEHHLTRVDV